MSVIPCPLDTKIWKPVQKPQARAILNMPLDKSIILFGSMKGTRSSNKGFDLLQSALKHLKGKIDGLELVVFGQNAPNNPPDISFPIHYVGHLHDDLSLRLLYSAADLLIVPSKVESFGQTASEAHSCGTPVVTFDNSGVSDIVDHHQTGYLARAFDIEDLAQGICWVLEDPKRHEELSCAARQKATSIFDSRIVVGQYLKVYQRVLDSS